MDFVNVEKVDIIFLTETWFNENSSCSLFGTFKPLARNDRKKGPRGGVAILVRSTFLIHAEELCPDEFDSAVAVGLQLSGNSALLVILVYLPYPSPYEVSMNDLERFFDAAACSFRYKYPSNQYSHSLCVLGDFNLPSTDWKLMHSSSAREQQFLNLFSDYGLSPLILNKSTHRDGNNLDNVLCGVHAFPLTFQIIETDHLSDHYPIFMNFEKFVQPELSYSEYYFLNHANLVSFENSWNDFAFDPYPSESNVMDFYNHLWNNIETSFSKKRKKRITNPFYYSSHTMHALNKLNAAKRKIVKNPSKNNFKSVEKLQLEFSDSAELDRISFINGASTNTLAECCTLLNSLKTNMYPLVMRHEDNRLKTGSEIANAFNIHFSSNFNYQHYSAIIYESDDSIKLDEILASLNPLIIRQKIIEMKESATTTSDFFPPKLLKLCPDVFATILHPLFCSIILTRSFPVLWKSALVRPIYKAEARNFIVNYRPISLLPKCSLLFEGFLFRHIYIFARLQIHPKQFGFQSKKNSV